MAARKYHDGTPDTTKPASRLAPEGAPPEVYDGLLTVNLTGVGVCVWGRSLGITSNLVFSEWERIFANPMATTVANDRVVHHAVILEFDVPGYRADAAQQRGQSEEVHRQN